MSALNVGGTAAQSVSSVANTEQSTCATNVMKRPRDDASTAKDHGLALNAVTPNQRSRTFMWTLNNYSETDEEVLKKSVPTPMQSTASKTADGATAGAVAKRKELHSYVLYGREIGESGTPHLQAYAETPKRMTLKAYEKMLHSLVPRAAKIQAVRDSLHARKYCMKDGQVVEYGTRIQQGRRSDLLVIQTELDQGATIQDIATHHFGQWVRYHQAFKLYIAMRPIVQTVFPLESFGWKIAYPEGKSLILWGESDIGKTEFAKALLGPTFHLVSHPDELLGYNPNYHSGILFDDMEFLHTPRTAQIHLLDWDNGRAIHCRYQTAWIPAKTKKVFTTNTDCGEIFLLTDKAIKRRVKVKELIKF